MMPDTLERLIHDSQDMPPDAYAGLEDQFQESNRGAVSPVQIVMTVSMVIVIMLVAVGIHG